MYGAKEGKEDGWEFLKKLDKNIGEYIKSGSRPAKMTAQGEFAVGASFDFPVAQQKKAGAPVEIRLPGRKARGMKSRPTPCSRGPRTGGSQEFSGLGHQRKRHERVCRSLNWESRFPGFPAAPICRSCRRSNSIRWISRGRRRTGRRSSRSGKVSSRNKRDMLLSRQGLLRRQAFAGPCLTQERATPDSLKSDSECSVASFRCGTGEENSKASSERPRWHGSVSFLSGREGSRN